MGRSLLHTPDGFRDIYDEECEKKLELERRIREVICSFGYRAIETPSVEFAGVFSGSSDSESEKELYRFFDRDGSTMALRPDFTPSVARSAAKYFSLREPVRLFYQGQTFVNHSSYKGMLKETTQLGAELMGDACADADAEVLAMVIRSLLESGLKQFQITVGHAGYFDSLAAGTGLDREQIEELKSLIRNRNSFGAERYLSDQNIPGDAAQAFIELPKLMGGPEILERARAMLSGMPEGAGGAFEALDRLEEVYDILKLYGLEHCITFDLSMLGSFMYYTGIIFRGYTYGAGDAIVKGGRYDHLLEQFGKNAPSTGFVIVIDQLLEALRQQGIGIEPGRQRETIRVTPGNRAEAIRRAGELRARGVAVELTFNAAGESHE